MGVARTMSRSSARLLVWASIAGLAVGVILELLTVLLAVAGPEGRGWSLRGNGALIVPLELAPAALGAGWTALLLHAHGRSWVAVAVTVCALGPLWSVLDLAAISLVQRELAIIVVGLAVSAIWLLPVLAPLAAWLATRGRGSYAVGWHAAAGAVYLVMLVVSFAAGTRLLPPS
ncbi:MAG: hypothetical protein M3072_04245 [Candidatus Dormibacteraeota bacterium]|nr:hypothetical protein [Candidatus Dormibacteraeota bacterium]